MLTKRKSHLNLPSASSYNNIEIRAQQNSRTIIVSR